MHRTAFWDAYLLFGPEARWSEKPEGMVSWGSTIIGTSSTLERDLLPLLALS